MKRINDITETLHHLILPYVLKAAVVVDCTCGNGHDAQFLLENAKPDARFYGFDIQNIAIENTRKRLALIDSTVTTQLILDSHENIDHHISQNIDVAMFNLGYLPGADHGITTQHHSTLASIRKVISLLSKGGVVSILIYSGHDSGKLEKQALLHYFETLDQKRIKVMRVDFPTSPNHPPEIYILQKVKAMV